MVVIPGRSIRTASIMTAAAWVLAVAPVHSQPIERVIVETYHVQAMPDGGAPLTTYRIYLDLAAEHTLQLIFGDENHRLRLETTTYFHNTDRGSVKFGDRLNYSGNDLAALATDSWLTIGMVGDKYVGVPKELDKDGSILECPSPTNMLLAPGEKPALDPLCTTDGLMKAPMEREVVNWRFESGYMADMKGATMDTNDGAWAVLGGMKGATEENIVLVAQIATTGQLHFILNAQVGKPDGSFVKVVANTPQEGELLLDQLTYGKRSVY